jgi:subtilisin family serine protease
MAGDTMAEAAGSLLAAMGLSLEELAARPLEPVDVAVVDSGVDATHPDLAGRVIEARRVEDTQIIDIEGPSNNDTYGHGTGVASIIARIAPNARLFDIRVLRPGNKGSGEDLLSGLRLAVRSRHKIINMSLASPAKFVPQLVLACERAYYQDQVIVAARRNMPISDDGFPAEFASVIGVDNGELPQPLSLRYRPNRTIEFEAPGDAIPVAAAGGGYTELSGTSFAAPMVSALCALLLGAFPALRPHEVRTVLCTYGVRG